MRGSRAHTARPYAGRNAIHRLAAVLDRVSSYQPREVDIDGRRPSPSSSRRSLVEGGVAANVVPDVVVCTLNHRVAPDRSLEAASAWLRDFLGDALEDGDGFEVVDWAPPAPPSMTNERLADLARRTGVPVRAKVGWTDVATFAALGIPATNFGAGDPLLAHRSDEFVTRGELDDFARVLGEWLASVAAHDRHDAYRRRSRRGGRTRVAPSSEFSGLRTTREPWGKNRLIVASSPGISASTISPVRAVFWRSMTT